MSLLIFDRRVDAPGGGAVAPELTATLSFEQRQKGRLRVRADQGDELALMVERGRVLRDGTQLTGAHGRVIAIVAQREDVSEVHADDAITLARAAYHLGNRHVALQIGPGWLRYQHDHVLDEMLTGLGLEVRRCEAPFEPESGAYSGGHHHHHGHAHSHD